MAWKTYIPNMASKSGLQSYISSYHNHIASYINTEQWAYTFDKPSMKSYEKSNANYPTNLYVENLPETTVALLIAELVLLLSMSKTAGTLLVVDSTWGALDVCRCLETYRQSRDLGRLTTKQNKNK